MGRSLLPTCLLAYLCIDLLFEYLCVSFPTAAVHPDMCGAMGVRKYNCAASGGEHGAVHGAIPQRDD